MRLYRAGLMVLIADSGNGKVLRLVETFEAAHMSSHNSRCEVSNKLYVHDVQANAGAGTHFAATN